MSRADGLETEQVRGSFFLFFSGSETFGEGIARPALSVQFPRQCLAVREYHDADWQCSPLRSSDSLFDGWL